MTASPATEQDKVAAQQKLFELAQVHLTLADRFLVPPFSVLDARAGYWQKRKSDWMALGIASELGREAKLLGYASITGNPNYGEYNSRLRDQSTSVFDPVLCEVAYRWFAPEGGMVLDPFAGGSVRGIVAGAMKRGYLGVDLRIEQVEANVENAKMISVKHELDPHPQWVVGDSVDLDRIVGSHKFDAVFSCPPYFDLEQYSDNPRDLSNMSWDEFMIVYRNIIGKTVAAMKPNTFAVWVIGEVRDGDGHYRGLVPLTIRYFEEAGAKFYNEGILVTMIATASVRVSAQFGGNRKLGKTHQQMLVFVKGSAKEAAAAIPVPEAAVESGGAVWHADGMTAEVPDTGETWEEGKV